VELFFSDSIFVAVQQSFPVHEGDGDEEKSENLAHGCCVSFVDNKIIFEGFVHQLPLFLWYPLWQQTAFTLRLSEHDNTHPVS
jgi:hypothetical protein